MKNARSLTSLSVLLFAAACGPKSGSTESSTTCSSADCETDPTTGPAECNTAPCPEPTTTTGPNPCESSTCGGEVTTSECESGTCGGEVTTSECESGTCGGEVTTSECESGTCGEDTIGDTDTDTASNCAPGSGDLVRVWDRTDPDAERGEAVATGAGRVAWVASSFQATHLRVLDLDGASVWETSVTLQPGEAELTFKDVAFDATGAVVLAGTAADFEAEVRWFDADGAPLGDDGEADAEWSAVAALADGTVAVAGAQNDDILVRRYAAVATPAWSQPFSGMGAAWAADIAVTPAQGLVVAGHSNEIPGPVLLAYDGDGALQWSHVDPGGPTLELGLGVASDSAGRIFLVVSEEDGGRVDVFDASGLMATSVALDYQPRSIAVDADDHLVIAGQRFVEDTIFVERRSGAGELLASHERPGDRALGVAVDADCHAYVVGYDGAGAWLDKLQ